MTILSKMLRRQLETAVKDAREIAVAAGREAVARLGVGNSDAPPHLSDANKALRRRLRAHARTLGDTRDEIGGMTTVNLEEATAYERWHRMLFGRFLAERGLLIHPELGVAISVTELRELANDEGLPDEWALAEQYAAPGLPGVFRPDDPVLSLQIAPEFSKRLRAQLSSLPVEVFLADDSLGWTYQFWRASEKDAINLAGGKIGAAELPAVTQLFTEPYMVKFLLQNTLGAWWAGKVLARDPALAQNAPDENALREACAVDGVTWEFLRFIRDADNGAKWRPAAGTFPGWPTRVGDITYCDPCCGSGHFLVEALAIFTALRRHEEGMSSSEAAVAVLRDNLHGLEIDGRCVQIAAFNVALAAWKEAGGPIALLSPQVAWVGASPPMSRAEMAALGSGDLELSRALAALHDRFAQAPLLGSLLEVESRDLLDDDLRRRGDASLARLREAEPDEAEGAVAARGLLDASALLARTYVLLATNVPFLGRAKQTSILANYLSSRMPDAKADLATAMLQRMEKLTAEGGTVAAVSGQNWWYLGGYRKYREQLMQDCSLLLLAQLGANGFSTPMYSFNVALTIVTSSKPIRGSTFIALDAAEGKDPLTKSSLICNAEIRAITQASQRANPDSRISLHEGSEVERLADHALSAQGLATHDDPRFRRKFWEISPLNSNWAGLAGTAEVSALYAGRDAIFMWGNGGGEYAEHAMELKREGRLGGWKSGKEAWGRRGVSISQMGSLPATIHTGDMFDHNAAVVIPKSEENLAAIWCFCSSPQYVTEVRKLDQKLMVTNATLVKVPFELSYWRSVAAERYALGLPEPYSDDPTQWIFHGHPAFAAAGTELHVALARLAGYRWPAETDTDMPLAHLARERIASAAALTVVDADGLLPLNASPDGQSLADRLRDLLAAAYGAPLSRIDEQAIIRSTDARFEKKEIKDQTLEGWLADRAFRQHCILFDQRPFLWHIWDGIKGGFAAFLHYHRLDGAALSKLTYTLLGDWIRIAKAEDQTARLERAERLQQNLRNIIEGEVPFDIFVRWKSLSQQPIGWEPNPNDGVRLNIRPFVIAGILREQPKGIHWNKDRGTAVASNPWVHLGPSYGGMPGDRINDHHTALAEKRLARNIA